MTLWLFIITFLVMFAMIGWKMVENFSDREFWLSRFVYRADCLAAKSFKKGKKFLKIAELIIKFIIFYKIPALLWKVFVSLKKTIDRVYSRMFNFMRGRHEFKKSGPVSFFLKSVSDYRNSIVKGDNSED